MAPKGVFAHYMIGCSKAHTRDTWREDMRLAQEAHIDAFVLNISSQDPDCDTQLSYAFLTANETGFKCLISFDFQAQGPFSEDRLVQILSTYGPNGGYYQVDGRPLVSTFEGGDQADLWARVKQRILPICFIPDWSGSGWEHIKRFSSLIDGHFTWHAWPKAPEKMNTAEDDATKAALPGKLYMMAVSPWFYVNIGGDGWSKNWTWRGDNLWYDRWQQVLQVQPDFVQIISWNDYAESHYIGPIRKEGIFPGAWYVDDHPHDAWRSLLPYFIDTYKTGGYNLSREHIVFWYRRTSAWQGDPKQTRSNPDYGHPHVDVRTVHRDRVYVIAVVAQIPAQVHIKVAGEIIGSFDARSVGLNEGHAEFDNKLGSVTVEIVRNGQPICFASGDEIFDGSGKPTEFNPCVYSS